MGASADPADGGPGVAGDGADLRDAAWLLLDQARIVEGAPVPDPAAFAQRLATIMARGLAASPATLI